VAGQHTIGARRARFSGGSPVRVWLTRRHSLLWKGSAPRPPRGCGSGGLDEATGVESTIQFEVQRWVTKQRLSCSNLKFAGSPGICARVVDDLVATAQFRMPEVACSHGAIRPGENVHTTIQRSDVGHETACRGVDVDRKDRIADHINPRSMIRNRSWPTWRGKLRTQTVEQGGQISHGRNQFAGGPANAIALLMVV